MQDAQNIKSTIPAPVREEFEFLGDKLIFEFNHFAYKADAALTLQRGETVVLATVTSGKLDIEANFLPLSVEYIEKYYAGGIISSSRFIKREMRPSESATLKARAIDHAIRSLFPKSWRKPVSVTITVLAYDGQNDPDQLAVIAASTALMMSSVPFAGPSASVKVGLNQEQELVWSPTVEEEEELLMDMVVAAVGDRILNIEGWADEVDESVMEKLMRESVANMQSVLNFQVQLAEKYGRKKQEYSDLPAPEEMIARVKTDYAAGIENALKNREIRIDEMNRMKAELAEKLATEGGEGTKVDTAAIEEAFEYIARRLLRDMALQSEKRSSGRNLNEIRPLRIETGVLPRVHGSAVFTRGQTQSLSILTLGSMRMAQTLESFEGEESKRFMHHYSSPNYSYGDAGRFSYYPGRREIGHGNIGENALRRMIPAEADFPYTIRVASEIMSSNGSTSMAATCATSLALLDGGVPIKAMVAGVALGLITDDNDVSKYKILVDMEDVEDFYGDMDFKVAGSEKGITAIQMDNKLKGVPVDILVAAFAKSKAARLEILAAMKQVISAPRADLSPYAPKVEVIKINPEDIGELIGPGGKVIKGILEACENKVDIDIQDSGDVYITGVSKEYRDKAIQMVKAITEEAEIGATYEGKVGKVAEYGIFVDVSPRISGLVHVSELSNTFVKDVASLYKVGDVVKIKVIGRDDQGRLKLSVKQVEGATQPAAAQQAQPAQSPQLKRNEQLQSAEEQRTVSN
jgi:polyribonucleotide nucleotidyltransferase